MESPENPLAPPQPPAAESPAPESSLDPQTQALAEQAAGWVKALESGGRWFYWVAGLSLVNSAIMFLGGDIHFVLGLGVTLVADAVAQAIGQQQPQIDFAVRFGVLVFDVCIAAMVFWAGRLTLRRWTGVCLVGMLLYALDGALFLLFGDMMSVIFHAVALWGMFGAYRAGRQLNALERQLRETALAVSPAEAPA